MQQGGAADLSSRMDSLQMESSQEADAAQESQEGMQASIGPGERRRLTVASMSSEDIVLCVDVGPEMGSEWIGAGPGGGATSRMRVVQAALSGFVRRKCTFNSRHRFALLALGDCVRVMRTMTSDIRSITEAIEHLQPDEKPNNPLLQETPFDFSELLACIAEQFPPPPTSSLSSSWVKAGAGAGSGAGAVAEVRRVVRALVVFGRSFTCPLVPAPGTNPLLHHERFFLDCVYLHRKPSEEGVVCQEAFDLIAGMESSSAGNHSYFLECGHSLLRFNSLMGSLLAHPVQRDYQEAFFDKLAAGGSALNVVVPAYKGSPPRASNQAQSSSSASPSVVASSSLGGGGSTGSADGLQ